MKYYDYPENKIEIFEPSESNYFFGGTDYSYLCTYDEVQKVDMWTAFSGFVLAVYKRYAVIRNGIITYKNEAFEDGHIARGRYKENGYVIISNKKREYFIQSWNQYLISYEIRDNDGPYKALNPRIYQSVERAVEDAVELSRKSDEILMVAQWFDECDRH